MQRTTCTCSRDDRTVVTTSSLDCPVHGVEEWERRYVTPVGNGIGVFSLNAPLQPESPR